MATLRDIRNRISGVRSIEKITSAMKMVSSIKAHRAQKIAENARPYHKDIEEMLRDLLKSQTDYTNPLLAPAKEHQTKNPASKHGINNVVIVIVAGDKGMCGAFNNNLFKIVDTYLHKDFKDLYPEAIPHLILIGNKAIEHYKKMHYKIIAQFEQVFSNLQFSLVEKIRDLFLTKFLLGEVDRVELYYNKFVNVMKQVPTNNQLLPILFEKNEEEKSKHNSTSDYIYEPDKETILDSLINQYLDLSTWKPILESNAAEQAARLIAMDKATQNAQDLIKELELQYNNARQAAITTEMLEIVGGAEALKK